MLLARDIPHGLTQDGSEHVLHAPAACADRAREELAQYERENRNWPPVPAPLPTPVPGALPAAMIFAVILVLFFGFERNHSFDLPWQRAGVGHAASIRAGEWWRTVTSLCLHENLPHVFGNIVFGTFFGWMLTALHGAGLGWFAILVTGSIGNGLNALIQDPGHRSLGASTAVFAAIGLFAGSEWRRRHGQRDSRWRRATPLVAGIFFLAWLGMGGERTDVWAHLMGFVAGLPLGAALSSLPAGWARRLGIQRACAAAALGLLALAWGLALR